MSKLRALLLSTRKIILRLKPHSRGSAQATAAVTTPSESFITRDSHTRQAQEPHHQGETAPSPPESQLPVFGNNFPSLLEQGELNIQPDIPAPRRGDDTHSKGASLEGHVIYSDLIPPYLRSNLNVLRILELMEEGRTEQDDTLKHRDSLCEQHLQALRQELLNAGKGIEEVDGSIVTLRMLFQQWLLAPLIDTFPIGKGYYQSDSSHSGSDESVPISDHYY